MRVDEIKIDTINKLEDEEEEGGEEKKIEYISEPIKDNGKIK